MSFPRRVLSLSLIAACSTILITGCGSILRQAVNHKYPPVSPELRQLGAITAEEKALSSLGTPTAYSFLSSSEVNNYLQTALAQPYPLNKDTSAYLASSPVLTGAHLTFGKQEVAFATDFFVEFTGQHKGIDINRISVSGHLDVRLYPELVPSPNPSIAAAVRLRPAISSFQLCKLDLSKSSHTTLYWFERRDVLSSVLNSALEAFRDNVNGQIHLDLPLPLGAVNIGKKPGDSSDGLVMTPATLAAIQPQFASGIVMVSPKGLTVLAEVRLDILDPSAVPVHQVPPALPPESLPKQAPAKVIDAEFEKFEGLVSSSVATNFGPVPDEPSELLIKKSLIANSINAVFDSKQIQLAYASPLAEYGPQSDADKELHLPDKPNLQCDRMKQYLGCDSRGTCVPYLVGLAQQNKNVADQACSDASSAIQKVAGTIDHVCNVVNHCIGIGKYKVCTSDIFAPGLCDSAKATLAANRAALVVCQGTVDFATKYLSAPQDITDDVTQKLGLGHLYSEVCKQYNTVFNGPQCAATKAAWDLSCGTVQLTIDTLIKGQVFATMDWGVQGVGNDAIKATASINKVHVSDNLDRADISGLSANGSVTAEGWAKFTPKPAFYPICPPPPCAPGQNCRIRLSPTTINATFDDDHIGAGFGMASFPADGYPNGRNGFFVTPDAAKIDVKLNSSLIGKLIRGNSLQNALQMPCALNSVVWDTYNIADVVSLTGFDINISHTFDPGRKRVGWADSQVELPISWKNVDGQIQVADKLKLPLTFSIDSSTLSAHAGQIPAPTNASAPAVYRRPTTLEITGGLGTGFVLTSRGGPQQSNTFWSPVIPYTTLSYKSPYIGAFGALMPGPKWGDFATGVGLSSRPFPKMSRINLLVGARLGPSNADLEHGPHFMFAIGWDIDRLALRGCEQCK